MGLTDCEPVDLELESFVQSIIDDGEDYGYENEGGGSCDDDEGFW